MPDDRPMDLRGEGGGSVSYSISRNTVLFASGLLVISGLVIGLLIPELTAEDLSGNHDAYSTPLSVLLSSTIDEVTTEDSIYTDIQVPVAYMIFFTEESPNMTGTDGILSEYLEFLLDEPEGFTLTISSGQNWEDEITHTINAGDQSSGDPKTSDQEVIVDISEGSEITLNFKLEVWEGPVNENE